MSASSAPQHPQSAKGKGRLAGLDRIIEGLKQEHHLDIADVLDDDLAMRRISSILPRYKPTYHVLLAEATPHAALDPLLRCCIEDPPTIWERFRRIAVATIVLRMRALWDPIPTFKHNCPECVYLGHMLPQPAGSMGEHPWTRLNTPRVVDLYVHRSSSHSGFVVRYGNQDNEFYQCEREGEWAHDPHFVVAADRAWALGL